MENQVSALNQIQNQFILGSGDITLVEITGVNNPNVACRVFVGYVDETTVFHVTWIWEGGALTTIDFSLSGKDKTRQFGNLLVLNHEGLRHIDLRIPEELRKKIDESAPSTSFPVKVQVHKTAKFGQTTVRVPRSGHVEFR